MDYKQLVSKDGGLLNHARLLQAMVASNFGPFKMQTVHICPKPCIVLICVMDFASLLLLGGWSNAVQRFHPLPGLLACVSVQNSHRTSH